MIACADKECGYKRNVDEPAPGAETAASAPGASAAAAPPA
jgi:hypothetical protein